MLGDSKNEIARNCDFTMNNLILQLESAFDKVTAKTCAGLIRKIRDVEDAFWRMMLLSMNKIKYQIWAVQLTK